MLLDGWWTLGMPRSLMSFHLAALRRPIAAVAALKRLVDDVSRADVVVELVLQIGHVGAEAAALAHRFQISSRCAYFLCWMDFFVCVTSKTVAVTRTEGAHVADE